MFSVSKKKFKIIPMNTNWPMKKLGEVAGIIVGKTPRTIDYLNFGEYKVLKYRDITKNGIDWDKYDKGFVKQNSLKGLKEVQLGDLLITSAGHSSEKIGEEAVVIEKLPSQFKKVFFASELICYRAILKIILPEWLLLYILSEFGQSQLKKIIGESVHLTKEKSQEIEIPVPAIEEQRKIVKKLEKILAKIEGVHSQRQESIKEASLVIFKKIEEIFSQYLKYKIKKVQDIAEVGTGATPLRGKSNYYGGTIPWVTSGSTSKPYITEANEYITELALKETNCRINKKHTLVVAMYGEGKTRGQVSELLIDAATNQACATISVNRDIVNQRFLKYFFELNYKKTRELSRGGPQSNLNLTRIKNIELPVPDLKEQGKIVAYLDGLSEKVQKLQKLQQEQLQGLEALQKSVLHQAFQGAL